MVGGAAPGFASAVAGAVEWNGDAWRASGPGAFVEPPPRVGAGAAWDAARRSVVVFGGSDGQLLLDDTWECTDGAWRVHGPGVRPPSRAGHAMAADPLGRGVLLFGGRGWLGELGDTWLWDGAQWARLTTPVAPPPRTDAAMVLDRARGRLVLFGGCATGQSTSFFADTWEFDGQQWQAMGQGAPAGRCGHVLVHDPGRGRTLMVGGRAGSTGLADAWEWDGATWQPAIGTGFALVDHVGFYDADLRRVVIHGGTSTVHKVQPVHAAHTWVGDGSGFAPRDFTPNVRDGHAMLFDAKRGETLLVGGGNGRPEQAVAWLWNGAAWRATPSGPSARRGSALAFDARRGRAVLFGGRLPSGAALADTWEWDGVAWQQSAASAPAARHGAAMVYDAARGRVLLAGGESSGGVLGDTWSYDGTAWSVAPASMPARRGHAVAYDPSRARVVLFGGIDAAGFERADTLEWDGVAWRGIAVAGSPPARSGHAMAFDPGTGRVLLVGGRAGGVALADAWEFGGASWTRAAPLATPRGGHAMVHDARRGQVLVYGGGPDAARPTADLFSLLDRPAAASYVPAGCSAALLSFGEPVLGSRSYELEVRSGLIRQPAVLLLSAVGNRATFACGQLAVLPLAASFLSGTGTGGGASFPLPLPSLPALAGVSVFAQAAIQDPGAAARWDLSHALRLDLGW